MGYQNNRFFLTLIALISVYAICLAIYWPGLSGPLLLDDIPNLGNILDPNFGHNQILINTFSNSGILKRPISMLSFIGNGLLTNDTFFWKLTNLFIHIANGILVYFLTVKLLRLTNSKNNILALAISTIWVLHPIHISTILYTVQRMTELSALFSFAALLTYLYARDYKFNTKPFIYLQILTWLFLFPLGILSKENALLTPVFILCLEIFVLNQEFFNKKRLINLFIFSVSLLLILSLGWNDIFKGYETRDFTLVERVYTESRIIIIYIGMLLIPAQMRMGFAHDDISISHGLLDPWTTLPSILMIAILLILGVMIRKKHPLIGLGITYFFVGHAMESTIIPLDLMYEHRNYLPSYGIFLAVTTTIATFLNNKSLVSIIAIIIFSLLTYLTSIRAQTWSSSIKLYYYMEMTHPNSMRLSSIKAEKYSAVGYHTKAREELIKYQNLGAKIQLLNISCTEYGFINDKDIAFNTEGFEFADNYATLQLTNLANKKLDNECAISTRWLLQVIERIENNLNISRNNHQIILMYKAHLFWDDKNQAQALSTLYDNYKLNTNNPIPLFLACEWLLDLNRLPEAKTVCTQGLETAKISGFNRYSDFIKKINKRLINNFPP